MREHKIKTTLFIPTFNEVVGARLIMPRVKREWVDEIIVVDGGSTDGTVEYFKEIGIPVIRQKSKGICDAYWECIEAATGDIIISFSPDNNSLPEAIPSLVAKMKEGYEMVIASRYLDGAKSEDDDFVTAFGNWMFTKIVNLLFGGNYTDSLVMFRAFRKDLPTRLYMGDRDIPVFEMLLCIRCAKQKLKTAEIPADEPKRVGGIRKMRPIYNGLCLLWVIVKEVFNTRDK